MKTETLKNNNEVIKERLMNLLKQVGQKKSFSIIFTNSEIIYSFNTRKMTKKFILEGLLSLMITYIKEKKSFCITLREYTGMFFDENEIHKISSFVYHENQFVFVKNERLKNIFETDKNTGKKKSIPTTWRFIEFEYKSILEGKK